MGKRQENFMITEITGVDEKTYQSVKLTLTNTHLIVEKDGARLQKYKFNEISQVKSDSSRIIITTKSERIMLLIMEGKYKDNISYMESEILRLCHAQKVEMDSNLHGAAKKQEKQYKKSYRKQITIASCIIVIFTVVFTIGLVLFQHKISNLRNETPQMSQQEIAMYREKLLEDTVDHLLKTKTSLSNIVKLIDEEIMLKGDDFNNWKNIVNENYKTCNDNKVKDFTFDSGYKTLIDGYVQETTSKIYDDVDQIYNTISRLLINKTNDKTLYLDVKRDIDSVKLKIDTIIREALTEKNS